SRLARWPGVNKCGDSAVLLVQRGPPVELVATLPEVRAPDFHHNLAREPIALADRRRVVFDRVERETVPLRDRERDPTLRRLRVRGDGRSYSFRDRPDVVGLPLLLRGPPCLTGCGLRG